jgi:hypothetical protein
MLNSVAMFKHFAPSLAAIMMLGFATDVSAAHGARAGMWRGGAAKTISVKSPAHVANVRHYNSRPARGVFVPRRRGYRSVSGHRHYGHRHFGHRYSGYGYYTSGADAFIFLGLTALTLSILDIASQNQQRAHQQAVARATTLPPGQSITWNDGPNTGAVTVIRTGTAANGQPCREFRQQVTIGGKTETAYGVACRQQDGAWRIVN